MRTTTSACAAFVAIAVTAGLIGGQAYGAEPWWHVSTISAPAGANAVGKAHVDLDISNVDDVLTAGTVDELNGPVPRAFTAHVWRNRLQRFRLNADRAKATRARDR